MGMNGEVVEGPWRVVSKPVSSGRAEVGGGGLGILQMMLFWCCFFCEKLVKTFWCLVKSKVVCVV